MSQYAYVGRESVDGSAYREQCRLPQPPELGYSPLARGCPRDHLQQYGVHNAYGGILVGNGDGPGNTVADYIIMVSNNIEERPPPGRRRQRH